MARVSISARVDAAAGQVWQVIGGFNDLADWVPIVERSEVDGSGIGSVRTLTLADGGTVKERLDSYDDGRSYGYSIVEAPLPVTAYRATIDVAPGGPDACTVTWSSTFEPSGAAEAEVVEMLEGLYRLGLDTLKRRVAG